jgi:hypothetical protein
MRLIYSRQIQIRTMADKVCACHLIITHASVTEYHGIPLNPRLVQPADAHEADETRAEGQRIDVRGATV